MAYLPLSTANLPDPVIDPAQGSSPEDYFNTVLYTGDGTTANAITGVGFQPDWLWIKQRNTARGHQLVDAVRGVSLNLRSDATQEETTSGVNSFDSDGFEVDATGTNGTNQSGGTYVAWNWKANGSGVSNTDGSITSSVSANTTSGFSIVSWVGTNANATVGHGLDQTPDIAIVKNREGDVLWAVYVHEFGGTKYLRLNDTTALQTTSTGWNNTDATDSVLNLGANSATNGSGNDMIAYCFHSVEGFSKCSSYVGNGSTDGPFVYTGFRPAFVIVKANANEPWWMMDSSRDSYNVMSKELVASGSDSEYDRTNAYLDFLSNGFKLRNNDGWHNNSGVTHIFMAFAENPFKYSNAR